MEKKEEPLTREQNYEGKLKSCESQSEPQPSTSTAMKNVKASVPNMVTGGGGADASHGQAFHLSIAILLLFSLCEKNKSEPGFDFNIWLEREGYGKFDDIVLQLKKTDGKRKQICVQCKHGVVRINPDKTRTVNNISAVDFLSNSSFGLINYLSSFVEIQSKYNDDDSYFVILTNRAYIEENCSKYPFFKIEKIPDVNKLISLDIFVNICFKLKYNDELSDFLLGKKASKNQNVIDFTKQTIIDFCDKFIYICDNRDLESTIDQKIAQQCGYNAENEKNLKARLYYLVSQMYQRKIFPTKNDIIDELNGKNIYFKIPAACPQFSGRAKEIQQINKYLESEKTGHIFDLLITGMAGMGKTQIVRKYIEDYKQNYKHIICINSESKDSLEKSFTELARFCNLISNDCKEEMSIIVNAIYSYFREQTLFVFDNTDKVLLSKNKENEYIYLPINDQYKHNKFIIISQDQKWTTNYPPIIVDKFSDEDAFIYLNASIQCSTEDKLKLASTFQYWPLAVCLAVSYIKLQTENSLGRRTFSDVINNLQLEFFGKHMPEIHEMEPYPKSLHTLWLMIRDKLQVEHKLALEILNVLAFSHPDYFPVELFMFDGFSESQVEEAIQILKNNSIVNVGDYKISIHRTLQLIIKTVNIDDINLYESILLRSTQCFNKYLESMNPSESRKSLGNIHMVTFLRHLCQSKIDSRNYIGMANRLLEKLNASEDLMGYCETDGIFYLVKKVAEDTLGSNHVDTLRTLSIIADMLQDTYRLVDSLKLIVNLIEKYTEKFGNKHLDTLKIWHRKGTVLQALEKYKEAMNVYNYVIEIRTEILGVKHPSLLETLHCKYNIFQSMGNYEEALNICNHIIEIETEILGVKHPSLLATLHCKAKILHSMGNYEEALNICNHVIEIRTEILCVKHPDLLATLHCKSTILHSMGNYEEALNICNHVIEIRTKILGGYHPDLLATLHCKSTIFQSMGNYEEALNICNHVIEILIELFGVKHPNSLATLNLKASIFQSMGYDEEALNICNHVVEIRREIFGEEHPATINCIKNRDKILRRIRKKAERRCRIL